MPGLQETLPLSSADVAALFRMSERAIRLWAAKGELPHMRTLGGGRLLYPADEIAALYAEHYAGALPRGRNPARAPARNSRRGAS
ncbi:MAG: helix-turn-helix domain-containing protein [Chloroflexi bacterium]|nr:helix-turn-helix domain-containing protein [Chloroflexota bacterium]